MAEGDLASRAGVERADEVGRLAVSFNAMAARIEGTVTALRRFVADAAHELGTPLTALQADLELADSSAEPDDRARLLHRAMAQARRLEDLSANLLRLSRIEAGETSPTAERTDLAAVVRSSSDAAASRAEQAGVTLTVDVAGGGLTVDGDPAKLGVVIDNLLGNAVKFTPEGGRVEVGARRDGPEVVAWVADTGIGIPEAEQAHIFERFFRARNVPAYAGSGLGLAIVRATVESLGGSVGFVSSAEGTRFEVRLPAASGGSNG